MRGRKLIFCDNTSRLRIDGMTHLHYTKAPTPDSLGILEFDRLNQLIANLVTSKAKRFLQGLRGCADIFATKV